MADDAARVHREWLGYLQPTGLLFSSAALTQRGVLPDANVGAFQEQLDAFARRGIDTPPTVADFPLFAQAILGWRASDLAGAPDGPPLPESLEANLVEYEERLAPTFAVPGQTAPVAGRCSSSSRSRISSSTLRGKTTVNFGPPALMPVANDCCAKQTFRLASSRTVAFFD